MVQIPVEFKNETIFNKLPVLLYAGQISDEPDWKFPSHKHDDLSEIIYISEGEGEFIIGNKLYQGKKGNILIYNRGVIHDEKSNPDNPLKTYFCGIGNLELKGLNKGCIIPEHVEPVINADNYTHKIETYISEIFEECNLQVMGYETICQNLLVSLIVLILRIVNVFSESREIIERCSPLGNRIKEIKEYIDRNYTRDISLGHIADRLYISQDYLSHVFKNETGYSPINYLINRRVGEAKKLLLTTDMSIQQISLEVGYENTGYFSTLFKKIAGISPGMFRDKNRSGKR
jgi:AraC-like DNA-binding protein/mannose-6-phosphate isomerase-like protein (cupin superfamily)